MTIRVLALCAAMAGFGATRVSAADQPVGAAGHWDGTIVVTPPGAATQNVPMAVDLDHNAAGGWKGSIDIGPRIKGLELTDIQVNGPSVHFVMRNMPGNPTFDGSLSPDGKIISGNAIQAGEKTTFTLTRNGPPKVAEPLKSTTISKDLQGKWQGALHPDGQTLNLVLELTAESDGTGNGTLTSVDQGNNAIPLSQFTQSGKAVTFVIQPIAGKFEGKLSDDGTQLAGTWTQGPNTLPLTFTKEVAHATAP